MAWTNTKTAVTASAVAVLAIGITLTGVAVHKSHQRAIENYFVHWQSMDIDKVSLPEVVLVRPTKYYNRGNYIIISAQPGSDARTMRRGAGFPEVLQTAYGFSPEEMILPPNLPRGQFDLLLTDANRSREKLRAEIKRQFGIVAHPESREVDVLVLKCLDPHAPGLKIAANSLQNIWTTDGSIKLRGFKMGDIAHILGGFYNQPVIDETGLTDAYDVDAKWNSRLQGRALQQEIETLLRNQFGLELTPDKRPVQLLVVEKI